MNTGVAPADPATPIGKIRLLLGDSPKNVENGQGEYAWYSDDELTALLELHGGDARRVAVGVLRLVAITPALKLKKWNHGELAVDGPAITRALNDAADKIEAGLFAADGVEGSDYANVVPTGYSAYYRPERDERELERTTPFGIM